MSDEMRLKEATDMLCSKSHGREGGRNGPHNGADIQGPRKDCLPVPLLVTESLPQTRPGLGIEVLVLNRDSFDFNQCTVKVGDLSQCNISALMRKPGLWDLKEGRNPNLNEGEAPEKES